MGFSEINEEWANKHMLTIGNQVIDISNVGEMGNLMESGHEDQELDRELAEAKSQLRNAK